MTIDIASVRPKVSDEEIVRQYLAAQMQRALDELTEELMREYIQMHELSRGAAVGNA